MALYPCEPWCIIKCFTAENEADFEILLEQSISLEDLNNYVQQKCGDTYRCYILRGTGTLRKLRRDSEFQDLVQKCNQKVEIYVKKSRTLSHSTKQVVSSLSPLDFDSLGIEFFSCHSAQIKEENLSRPSSKRGHRRTKSAHASFNSTYIPEPAEGGDIINSHIEARQYNSNYSSEGRFVPANRCYSPDSGFQSPENRHLILSQSEMSLNISLHAATPYDGDIPRHLTEEFPTDTDTERSNFDSSFSVPSSTSLSYKDLESSSNKTDIQLPDGYLLKHMIGSGGFAKVYLCIELDTGCDIALKQMLFDSHCKHSNRELKALTNEIDILKSLEHPNIVTYFGSSFNNGSFNIFMEYISGGSMHSFIQSNGPLSTKFVVKCLGHILSGLHYLHSKQVVHRDLKAANILRTSQGAIKIADFGASKQFDTLRSIHGANTVVGTPYWMSPEVIKAESMLQNLLLSHVIPIATIIVTSKILRPPAFKKAGEWGGGVYKIQYFHF